MGIPVFITHVRKLRQGQGALPEKAASRPWASEHKLKLIPGLNSNITQWLGTQDKLLPWQDTMWRKASSAQGVKKIQGGTSQKNRKIRICAQIG